MRFNLLLYVATLVNTLDVDYGIFIQHHLMDDPNINLDYFDFSKINPETYALDIVEKNPVTPQIRRNCLVEGFTLNSYLTLDLDRDFNRNIHADDVRQIFICFKNRSTDPIDAFIRLTEDHDITDYQIHNNLIFFRLWVAPELTINNDTEFNIAKINYSNFEYFCETIKSQLNQQWHAILNEKRHLSKAKLTPDQKDSQVTINDTPPETEPQNSVKLTDIYSQYQASESPVSAIPIADVYKEKNTAEPTYDWLESQREGAQNSLAVKSRSNLATKPKKNARFWPLMGYLLLFLVLSSFFEGLFS